MRLIKIINFGSGIRWRLNLTQKNTAIQKLQYIHDNPLAEHWQLTDDPVKYYYSSAKYYETGIDDFGFLNNIVDMF
ncbi:hypothetical protein [Agriterribacter humi]|uniref:hypothetical protein n=1 Tax=Agriterribacter humi TaxID=1104781 RepID=UPI0012646E4C|nr:hypothetical protein [Agriterribacter humi]